LKEIKAVMILKKNLISKVDQAADIKKEWIFQLNSTNRVISSEGMCQTTDLSPRFP
jgi:hypothetical protein